ncbi:hypothetical protein ACFVSW_22875 [Neobacillus sp. NPDC058068]|uniref:hypothetical protein n=1 Tax=Neobacillus sp. NPDC058068 TaxID=3346325 RepID=UPI0036DC5E98
MSKKLFTELEIKSFSKIASLIGITTRRINRILHKLEPAPLVQERGTKLSNINTIFSP